MQPTENCCLSLWCFLTFVLWMCCVNWRWTEENSGNSSLSIDLSGQPKYRKKTYFPLLPLVVTLHYIRLAWLYNFVIVNKSHEKTNNTLVCLWILSNFPTLLVAHSFPLKDINLSKWVRNTLFHFWKRFSNWLKHLGTEVFSKHHSDSNKHGIC